MRQLILGVVVAGLVAGVTWANDPQAAAEANKFVERGNEFVQKNSLPRAKAEYQRALREFPGHVDALYNLAIVQERLGETNAAVATYQRYLELKPAEADVWTQLGLLHEAAGDKTAAAADYRKAIAGNPQFSRAHHNLGVLLQEQGATDEARQHLQTVVQLAEQAGQPNGDAYYSLAVLELGQLRVKEAKQLLQKALNVDPSVPWYNNAMGDVYLLEKQPGMALAHYEKAVEKDPKNAVYYSGLGEARAAQGDRVKAVAAYRKALELRPDYAVVHFKLGLLYEATEPVTAIKEFESYLVSAKNTSHKEDVSQRLAKLKEKMKSSEK
jgi:superkiller protein 3